MVRECWVQAKKCDGGSLFWGSWANGLSFMDGAIRGHNCRIEKG